MDMENNISNEAVAVRTYARHVIFFPVDFVWNNIRDFGAHGSWLPHVQSTEMLNDKASGAEPVRRLRFLDGSFVDEQVTKMDDDDQYLEYTLAGESSWPIYDVRGIISVSGDANATLVERTVNFNCLADQAATRELVESFNATLADSLERLSVYLTAECAQARADSAP